MINPILFKKTLNNNGFEFFTGVPDSVLKHFKMTSKSLNRVMTGIFVVLSENLD